MDVLLAPCVESAVINAWTDAAPHDSVDLCELSDGSAGFAALVGRWAEAQRRGRDVPPESAVVWLAPGVVLVGETAYVDSSAGRTPDPVSSPDVFSTDCSGDGLAAGTAPHPGSAGVGEQVLLALGAGATRIVLGLAGPEAGAVPDAGTGLLAALGVSALRRRSLLDAGSSAGPGRDASEVSSDDLVGLSEALALLGRVDLVGACADDLPLLGLHGTSAAAGEAGALSPADAQQLERAVGQLAHAVWSAATATRRPDLLAVGTTTASLSAPGRLRDVTGLPGAGAGGGIGWLVALAGGRLLPGAAVHADAVDLRARAAAADLVVTTVDHLDASTFHGSGAEQAAVAAAEVGVPCIVVAGTSMMSRRESSAAGLSAVYVASEGPASDGTVPPVVLDDVVRRVARSWSPARTAGR